MFCKHIVIVTFAALFVAASSASLEKRQNAGMRRKVKEFTLCTIDQAEFYNEKYGAFFGPTESVKPLYSCEVSFGDCLCSRWGSYLHGHNVKLFPPIPFTLHVDRQVQRLNLLLWWLRLVPVLA